MKSLRSLIFLLVFVFAPVALACTAAFPGQAETPTPLPPSTETLAASLPTETAPLPTSTPASPTPAAPTATLPGETATPEPPTPTPTDPPSQLRIAFVNVSGNAVLWSEDSTELTYLTSEGSIVDVRLSSDGALIGLLRELSFAEQELWVVNADGSDLRRLLSADDFRALDPAALGVAPYQWDWLPGSHTLAFNTLQFVDGPGLFLYDDLHYLDAQTGRLTTILTPGSGGNFAFSPDGQQVAIITPETISLLNADGTNLRPDRLAYPHVLTYSEYEYYAEPQWAPDSSFLRVAIPPQDSLGDPFAPTALWEIPTDGRPAFQLGQVVAQPFFIDPVLYSPDLTFIAYTRLPDPAEYTVADLVIANYDGVGELVLATGNLFISGWAPDSRHLVFESFELQETYLGSVEGDVRLLTDVPYAREVTWLDETRFLFLRESARGWQMRIGEVGGGSVLFVELPGTFPVFDFDR